MSRKIVVFLGSFLIWAVAGAAEVELRDDPPGSYTVQKGDTLWDIAGRFLTRPWQWPEIWQSNPQIPNPHLIYPGNVIALSFKDGRPILGVSDGNNALGENGALTQANRNIKLSPAIRESRHSDSVEPIPLDAIEQFLTRPRVISEDELDGAAYIVGSQDEHLTFGRGSRVYVRALGQPETNKFTIFRQGNAYLDPDTQEILGYEAEHVGDALAERFGDPATVHIVSANKEIMKGDRLLPQAVDQTPEFVPHAPVGEVDAKIISVMNGFSQVSQHQVVVLNRGGSDGLEPGHVLTIYQDGEVIEDVLGSDLANRDIRAAHLRAEQENTSGVGRMLAGLANDVRSTDRNLRSIVGTPQEGGSSVTVQLPPERAGELMVFRSFDKVSYGLVMNTQRTVHINDHARNPD